MADTELLEPDQSFAHLCGMQKPDYSKVLCMVFGLPRSCLIPAVARGIPTMETYSALHYLAAHPVFLVEASRTADLELYGIEYDYWEDVFGERDLETVHKYILALAAAVRAICAEKQLRNV